MKKIIWGLITAGLFVLGGCAQMRWEKSGASQQDIASDKFECERMATVVVPPKPYVAPQGQMVSGYYVAPSWSQQLAATLEASGGSYLNHDLFNSCMGAKGYVRVRVQK